MKKTKELVLDNQQYKVNFQSADIDFPDYQQLEEQVKQLEDKFSNLVISPDDYDFAKDVKAEINKYKNSLTKHKNEIIKEANKPVTEFDDEIKSLTKRLAQLYKHINDQTKVLNEKKRSARKELRLKQIKKMCKEAGLEIDVSEFPYDSKWSNTNVSEKSFESAVNKEISLISEKKRDYQDKLSAIVRSASKLGLSANPFIQLFDDGHSLNEVLDQMDVEQKAVALNIKRQLKAKREEQARMQKTKSKAYDPKTGEVKGNVFKFKLAFSATKEQVKQLNNFLKQNNISAERVE